MAAKPQGKENVAAASSRFGYTGGARAKPRSAAAGAAERKPKSAAVPLQEKKDGDTIVDADPYNLQKTANEAMPDSDEQWREITRKHRLAEKGSNNKTKAKQNEEIIRLSKDLLGTMREQRSKFLKKAEEMQSDLSESLAELSTLLASAAETPELEVRQKELQDQVDGFHSQLEAAVSAAKQDAAEIQQIVAQKQLKDTELSKIQEDITSTLEEIEKTRALFRDETNKLMDARAAQNEDKTKLEASESELQSRWQEKEEDFRKLQQNHAQERERRAKTLEQELDERRKMSDKRSAAVADVARLGAHATLIERHQEEAKAELHEVRQDSVLHKERADRNGARVMAVNKEHWTLSESAAKLEKTVESKTADAATLRVQKDELVKQAAQTDQELRPVKQRKLALESAVGELRESNVDLNAQLKISTENMTAAEADAAAANTRMETSQKACADLETKMAEVQKKHKHTSDVNTTLQKQNQSLTEAVCTLRDQHAEESVEMQQLASKSVDVETELETLRSHSNMSATQQADALTACEERCVELRVKKQQLLRESSIKAEDMESLQATADANAKRLGDMGADTAEADAQRLAQWVTISELKGTIRVICRVCPNVANLQSGSVAFGPSSTGVDDAITVMPPQASAESAEGQAFVFDKVIPAQGSTEETFKHLRDLVDRAVAGEQVCVFACGQSGSGKSSVLGGVTDSCERTLLTMALEHFLDAAAKDSDWTYSTQASLAMINGNSVVDPMSTSPTTPIETSMNVDGTVSLTNLTSVPAYDRSAFMAQVTAAAVQVGADICHKVLTITTQAENAKDSAIRTGCLRFIELAGIEHLDAPVGNSDGYSQAAHTSLTELKQVFEAIINKQRPNFDAGILTQLSRPFLSGSGKALMLVHVPEKPTEASYHATVRALRLATQAASCEIGSLNQQSSKRKGGHNGVSSRGQRFKS